MQEIDFSDLVTLYVEMIRVCLPITCFFGLTNIIINMFTGAAFNGKLRIGRRYD